MATSMKELKVTHHKTFISFLPFYTSKSHKYLLLHPFFDSHILSFKTQQIFHQYSFADGAAPPFTTYIFRGENFQPFAGFLLILLKFLQEEI